jgi:hypothetical protein
MLFSWNLGKWYRRGGIIARIFIYTLWLIKQQEVDMEKYIQPKYVGNLYVFSPVC